ncbi:hypothetical protein, conserved [Babesia ovata]|uniref:RAP domain-containing protein n=1 Tax=Babesia ovata TaxID=189622 RepID=A0A2H6KEN9_9APIC|nr:uncharacterized protein BOVATA_029540 [Babesia ovata]GBE61461.1 hypothetical protein, conserved [Babesia ovata]
MFRCALRVRWAGGGLRESDGATCLGFLKEDKRLFSYYRFHKRVGKGNWNRYVERYTVPRSIENTQRITFNYRASFQAAKSSASYLWELPKRLAAATSADGVLDAWIHFRHKRKKAYHFVLALKRLCEVKDVDTSDWRFQFIAKKLLKRSKYFIDLPGVCHYLGVLRAVPTLDKLSIMLCEKIDRFSPTMLAQIAGAFGNCRLSSKHLFSLIARHLENNIHYASNGELATIAMAFGRCAIYNYGMLASISQAVQKRFSPALHVMNSNRELISTPSRHCLLNLQQEVTVHARRPSLPDLILLVEAFAVSKHRDTQLCDIISQMVQRDLASRTATEVTNPDVHRRIVRSFCSLKITDIPLFLSILDYITARPYNYSPACISEIGRHLSQVLPRDVDNVSRVKFATSLFQPLQAFGVCLDEIQRHLHRMGRRELSDAAAFAYKAYTSSSLKSDFMCQISTLLVRQGYSNVKYDAPKLMEVLSMHNSLNQECFDVICRDIYRVVDLFEPVDYQRTSRVLRKLKKDGLTNLKMVNMLSKRVAAQWEEFSEYQYHCVARDLTLAGPPFQSLLTDIWNRNKSVYALYVS